MSRNSTKFIGSRQRSLMLMLALMLLSISSTGCTALFSPIDTIPAQRVPRQFLAEPQADKVPIDYSRLRQDSPEFYTLDSEDVLGVFIENVLGEFGSAPPVQIPDPNSDLPPAIGFPVPIRDDGTVSLPLVDPIPVRGLTVQQAEALITRAYREGPNPILIKRGRIIVTQLRKRTNRVFVVRQDNSNAGRGQQFQGLAQTRVINDRNDRSSRGFVLQLPAGQNDVFTALSQTGGIPGVNAKAEIRILRGTRLQTAQRDARMAEFYRSNQSDQFPYGIVPSVPDDSNTLSIPLRLKPGQIPSFRPEDIILKDGDIVYVDSRETDVYYTGGLLGGGEFPLPRDYDLDVLSAVSVSRFGVGTTQRTSLVGGSVQQTQPSELILLRKIPGDRQLAIRIDLNDAVNDPRQRLLIKAGDTLILRFKPQEELINFASATFFTFGLRQLLN
ncbi:polysaccharide biosynthesis/export family protein [Mariniblastus fucicola]|uniref:polysaccharide biosynthesis/export family protein n=1 Tax=Mariniblastus fucicola TaxID=980251 RepID=UPI0012F9FDD1|nr:polysaccharide biosynthesis/export family protein [Mariniblastus fucicola]